MIKDELIDLQIMKFALYVNSVCVCVFHTHKYYSNYIIVVREDESKWFFFEKQPYFKENHALEIQIEWKCVTLCTLLKLVVKN